MKNPIISVVIPTHNRKATLARCLDSVLQQTYQTLEIIVVDDGSTDESTAWLRQYYPTVNTITIEHSGVSHARNVGIQAARGQWIALLDSDDAWQETKLQRQLEALAKHPARLCHTDEIWYRNGKRVNPMHKHRKYGGWILSHCLALCCISPSSVLIARDVFDEVGWFDTELPACEDYDLWLRICARMPVLYIDETLTLKYGGHADQLSRQHWGMDRFRIYALRKLIDSQTLNPDDERMVRQELCAKIKIFLIGARKHNNPASNDYAELLQQYQPN